MAKGSGTRSGLLWEVERILNECEELPQILLMENVNAVHNSQNEKHFDQWINALERLGYRNYWQDMNAADYGIAQHRERTFMVSLLGNYNFKFPKTINLRYSMADYLEDIVDEKYYINSEKALNLIQELVDNGTLASTIPTNERTNERTNSRLCVDGTINDPREKEIANCIKARYDAGISNLKSDGNIIVE